MKMTTKTTINKGVAGATIDDLAQALKVIAEMIMTESKTNYVPVVTGELRRSGTVKNPVITTNKVKVELGYGGAAVSYARAVHERPPTVGQGKNKYLSQPLNAMAPNIPALLTAIMQSSVKRRGSGTP